MDVSVRFVWRSLGVRWGFGVEVEVCLGVWEGGLVSLDKWHSLYGKC